MRQDYTLSEVRVFMTVHLRSVDRGGYLKALDTVTAGVQLAEDEATGVASLRRYRSVMRFDRFVTAVCTLLGFGFIGAAWALNHYNSVVGLFGGLWVLMGVLMGLASKPTRRSQLLMEIRKEQLRPAIALIEQSEADFANRLRDDLVFNGNGA